MANGITLENINGGSLTVQYAGTATGDRVLTLPEVDGGLAPTANPTFTGIVSVDSSIVFEGSTADAYETTLTVVNPTADRTLSLPNESGTLATQEYIPTALNASGSAPMYACRAWVNFNGTGTVAIRASGNVSSITDNGTGYYTVNFTTPMQDVNYALFGQSGSGNGRWIAEYNGTYNTVDSTTYKTTNSCRIAFIESTGVLSDNAAIYVAIFR